MKIRTSLAIALATLSSAAMAQDVGSEHFSFRLGAFFPNVDTKASVNASNGTAGTTVDFETDLKLSDSKTLPVMDATWRFSPRHRLVLDYFSLDRSASGTLSGTINWGDQVFTRNTTVKGDFNSDVLALTYLYSLALDKDSELAVGVGLHNTKFTAGISSTAGSVSVSKSANAPLPVLALQGTARFMENWRANAGVKWLSLKVGDYDGKLTVFQAGIQYFPVKNWGIEGAYLANEYKLDVSKPDYKGSMKYKFNGPSISLIGQF